MFNHLLALNAALIIGSLLDALLGDPENFPHPVRLMGRWIFYGERKLNNKNMLPYNLKLRGAVFVIGTLSITTLVLCILEALVFDLLLVFRSYPFINVWMLIYTSVYTLFFFQGIAHKNLMDEVQKVFEYTKQENLDNAKIQLARIVGRDTASLSKEEIHRAALETLCENFGDGVIAPLFYFTIAGVPGMICYKFANTFDSMIAYKSKRYLHFGFVAAKIDDLLSFIPARLSALLIAFASFFTGRGGKKRLSRSLYYIKKYARAHASPNAGYPEAALAGALYLRFGGPNFYKGQLVDKPYIGETDNRITEEHLRLALWIQNFAFTSALTFTLLVLAGMMFMLKLFL